MLRGHSEGIKGEHKQVSTFRCQSYIPLTSFAILISESGSGTDCSDSITRILQPYSIKDSSILVICIASKFLSTPL